MILIGRGLDLAQVLKKRSIGRKNGQSENHSMCSCQGAEEPQKREAEQATQAKRRKQATRVEEAERSAAPNKFTISGGNDERVTPVPIPNTEVKPLSADGTWLDTARESRSLPDST